jgi:uncharacterized protein YjbI with pentapeptide repeats
MVPQPWRTKALEYVMRLVKDPKALQRTITITVLLLLAVLTFSLVRTPSYERSFIYLYFLVFALGIIVVGVGLTLWASDRDVPGSRGNLGAALVSGAIVAFAIFGLQLAAERQADKLDERQRLQSILANEQELQSTDLSNRDLRGFAFVNKQLFGSNFTGSKLQGVDFTGAELREAIFMNADLEGAKLPETDLRLASFRGANLKNASLVNSDLMGADLREAELGGAQLTGAVGDTNTKWPSDYIPTTSKAIVLAPQANLQGVDLSKRSIGDVDLTEANLQNANLTDAYISGVNLTRANLQGAILKDALGGDTNFRGADLRGADLRMDGIMSYYGDRPDQRARVYKLFIGVIADSKTIWPEEFHPSRIPGGIRTTPP